MLCPPGMVNHNIVFAETKTTYAYFPSARISPWTILNQANPPMKKLSKRAIASRANGKLSHGPVSVSGKLRTSANSTSHGILANNLILDGESKEIFALLHQEYIDRIKPTDGIEISLVEELAAITWRQRRLLAIETNLFNEAAARHADTIASAFSDLSRGPELHLIDRYESRLHRMFQRTLKNIQLIRQIPKISEIHELPNEPRSEQHLVESERYPKTSIVKGGAGFSLLPTEPPVPFQQRPIALPPPANPKIIEFPNEPRLAQPPVKSTASPRTFTSNCPPWQPDRLTRIA
jgi:hypothetical protein